MTPAERRAKQREYMRKWRAAHPESRDYQRAYNARYLADPGRAAANRARAAQWYAANRERALAAASARNAARPPAERPRGPRHHNWRGDEASYQAVHHWVRSEAGSPSLCDVCGSTTARRFEWANIDHTYRRDLADWFRACTSCHRQHDYEKGIAQPRRPARVA